MKYDCESKPACPAHMLEKLASYLDDPKLNRQALKEIVRDLQAQIEEEIDAEIDEV